MSNFGGLNIASSGLTAHRKRIDVISENIVNANTPGYHRQRVALGSIDNNSIGVFTGRDRVGGGVEAGEISRLRDRTLSNHARVQAGVAAERNGRAEVLERIEEVIGGLDPGGLHEQMNGLFNSFDDLANSPDDLAIRQVVLQQAESISRSFGRATTAVDQLRAREEAEIVDAVRAINVLAQEIAVLDAEVLGSANSGADPNSTLDKRDLKITELANLVNVTVIEESSGQVSISVDGEQLVANGRSTPISVSIDPDAGLAPLGYDRISVTTSTGRELRIDSGALAAGLEATSQTIPDEVRTLDALIADLADQVNAIHSTGVALDGSTGLNLFDVEATTGELSVSIDVAGQPQKLAAAEVGGGDLDDSIARQLAHLGEDPSGPPTVFSDAVGALAARVATATGTANAADAASAQASALAQAAGGVSLDEELTDLITAQRAYEASARMITAIDEMLQTLIHSTGLVGR